ncbi:hypothetical protein [Saccharolobus shibatae]|nr:hypothetical protein [Saccharolobus shibatae]
MLALWLFGYRTVTFNFRGEYFFVFGIPDFIGGTGSTFLGLCIKAHILDF